MERSHNQTSELDYSLDCMSDAWKNNGFDGETTIIESVKMILSKQNFKRQKTLDWLPLPSSGIKLHVVGLPGSQSFVRIGRQNFCILKTPPKKVALARPWPSHETGQLSIQEINISHLGKRKIIFKMPFLGDMLVSWRVSIQHNIILFTPFVHHRHCRRRCKGLDSRGWTDRRRLNKNGEKLPVHLFQCPKSRPVPNEIQTKKEGLLLVS